MSHLGFVMLQRLPQKTVRELYFTVRVFFSRFAFYTPKSLYFNYHRSCVETTAWSAFSHLIHGLKFRVGIVIFTPRKLNVQQLKQMP